MPNPVTPPPAPESVASVFQTTLSFEPLIAWWQARIDDPNPGLALLARGIMREVEKHPELRGLQTDPQILEKHATLVASLMVAVFPPASFSTDIIGAVPPFQRFSFYHTPRFAEVLLSTDRRVKQPLNIDSASMEHYMVQMVYFLILEKLYGMTLPGTGTIIFTVPDYNMGLYRHYSVVFNSSFLDVHVVGQRPELTPDQLEQLARNPRNQQLWRELLPPENFSLEGFNLLQLTDVTNQEILSELKYDLLERDVLQAADRLEQIQEKMRVLFGRPALQLGIAAYDDKKKAFVDFGRRINHSFLMKQLQRQHATSGFRRIYQQLLQERRPLVLEDVQEADIPSDLREQLLSIGIRSVILALLPYGDDAVGLLEIGSPNAGDLTQFDLDKVTAFQPLFAVAVKRNAEELQTRVQAVIKEKFTAIHPALEWRFTDAALSLLEKIDEGNKSAEIEPIVFHDVYPLFGSADVRGSSTARNEAIQGDLIEHLTLANRVLKKATEFQALPILDELKFYVTKNLRRLKQGILSGDEVSIFESLKNEVEPLFQYLAQHTPELRAVIAEYWNNIDPELGILYKRRKAFEESITRLNDAVSDFLDEEDRKAQQMYPHYFQRFKTDGVEYNVYVGASLVHDKPFDLIFLKNLRLWQLLVSCEVARLTHRLKPTLPLPLDITQLLLIHSQSLSIRFRADEGQFDVDGAYNIRYEIIKKRIDKAVVLGTGERLTQPGHIALVYSQPREAAEYHEYIDYLQDRHLLEPEVEELELDELQGAKGLLALRVKVKMEE
ncbi:GAF domain-containing protein [Hymenobacter busanensis]|uniref:GAF domain-containing protein n=1 Tax=Hymenobacter busanensis TaxID=2607656 RepID=A0A7L5A0G9_9BACT|nr:GAF domain-containing protein [Hymenobacter busanensis]KAA9332442.1 GAF domain-containing protein [Hymenobacter busanensis]QHJ07220.1 GAF domain-containing protein [Hymenobacter busanensis]